MKHAMTLFFLLTAATIAAPDPYPITVNSQAETLPQLVLYRASQRTVRLTYMDGADASDITGATPWMSWSTNASASTTAATVA